MKHSSSPPRWVAAASLVALFVWGLAALGMCSEVDEAVLQAEADRVAVMAKAREAAVAIFSADGQGGGSGVVISPDGYALSNFHVTKGAGDAMKCGMAHGGIYDAVIVGIDPVGDVALLKLLGRDDFPYAELGDSDLVHTGDWVFAVGNPFLLATDFQPTVSYGIVSGVHRYQYPSGTLLEYADCIQTDAAINPGNSGGPLFDSQGRVIGINGRGSFEKRGRVSVGVGYAISINQIKNFLGHLMGGRIVDHATLGALVASSEDGRVLVSDILEDSDAYRRGLRYGDEIVGFGGRPIRTVNAFKNALGVFPKGWRVPLSFRRRGETHDVQVRLSSVHGVEELLEKLQGHAPEEPLPQPQDQPPGQEQPQEKPGEQPSGKPKPDRPQPPPRRPQPASRPMPDVVQQQFEAKRGFANYHFNKLNRDRVWTALAAHGDFSGCAGPWTLAGEMAGVGEAAFRISGQDCSCELPGGKLTLHVADDLTGAIDPPGSGGLLAALYLWRRLLVLGPEQFGSLEYLGTLPTAGGPPADVLVGTYGGVECRFFVETAEGRLATVEMVLRADDDPCELHLSDYRQVDGREVPSRIEVRYGDTVYALFTLVEINLSEQAPAAGNGGI